MDPMEISGKSFSATTSAKTSSLSTATSTSDMMVTEAGRKRKKMSSDERLNRNRERNRIHARKTRERKKFQTTAIQNRIHQLYEEGRKLRQMIDERYTASSLLGLSQSPSSKLESEQKVQLLPSTSICNNYYESIISENNWIKDTNGNPYFQPAQATKRVRRSGKLNPQEREKIRRERNRMHAKKTRDRKKFYLEMSDKIISEMEAESKSLRQYLREIGMISEEDYQQRTLKDLKAKQEIDNMKLTSMEDEDGEAEDEDEEDDDDEENGDTASENEIQEREERSPSGSSDENEKVSSWSRSSASSNPGSSGAQSMDFTSSKSHSSSNADTAKMSGSNYTTNDAKSSNASSDSFQDKQSGDNNSSGSDERDSPDYNANGMIINDNEWNEGDEYRERDDPSSDRSSEAPESYHHGRKRKVVKVVDPATGPVSPRNGKNNKSSDGDMGSNGKDQSGKK